MLRNQHFIFNRASANVLLTATVLLLGIVNAVEAQQTQSATDDPFASSLERIGPSWYDEKNDSAKWPGKQKEKAAVSANRAAIPTTPMKQPARPNLPNMNFDWLGPGTTWIVLGVLFLLLVGLFVWVVANMKPDPGAIILRSGELDDGNRVENLPFEVDRSIRNFREAALAAAREKNFRQAIIYLYSHALVTLDRKEMIQLRKGKTNRQYLNELLRRIPGGTGFRGLINDFEAVFFGNHPAHERDYDRVLASADNIAGLSLPAESGGKP